MKLGLVISSLAPGGAERVLVTLAGAWAERGHDVTLVTLSGSSSDFQAVPAAVRRVALDCMGGRGGPALAPARTIWRINLLRKALAAVAPDVVVCFMAPTTVLTLLAAGRSYPIVAAERTDPSMYPIAAPYRWLRRILYPRAAAVVAQTARAAATLHALAPGSAVSVVPGFVRTDLAAALPTRGPVVPAFVAVGRLVPQKGIDLLLQAFARVRRDLEGWRIQVIGSGPDAQPLQLLAGRLGISADVDWIPVQPMPWSAVHPGAVFVLASRFEGFPNVLLEAMALGLPVVATDCVSGPGEILDHERTGLLVPTGSVPALADAMRRMAVDEGLRARLGAAASEEVRRQWTLTVALDAWDEVLTFARSRRHGPGDPSQS